MPEKEQIPDIRDIIAPPEVIDPNINFLLTIGIAVGLIVILTSFLFHWIRFRKKTSPPQLNNHRKKALDQLHDLKLNHTKTSAKEVANIVITSLRPMIQSKFGNLSLSLTTDEFLINFRKYSNKILGEEPFNRLSEILIICDRLRFSPDNDCNEARENLIVQSIELVRNFPRIDENSTTN